MCLRLFLEPCVCECLCDGFADERRWIKIYMIKRLQFAQWIWNDSVAIISHKLNSSSVIDHLIQMGMTNVMQRKK